MTHDRNEVRADWVRRQQEHGNKPRAVLMKGLPARVNDSIDQWHRSVLRLVFSGAAPGHALDIGCGFGRLANEMPPLNQVPIGIDFTPQFCAGFAANHGEAVCGDLAHLPFRNEVFSGAYSVTSLMYLDMAHAKRALADIDRCLTPGATVLVLEPCREFNSLVRAILTRKRGERLAMPGFALEGFNDLLPPHWQPLGAGACNWMTATLPLLALATHWPRLYHVFSNAVLWLDRPRLDGRRAHGRISLYRWVACKKPA